jgi:hypothetical protein
MLGEAYNEADAEVVQQARIIREQANRIAALEAENAKLQGVDVLITKLSQPCTCQPPGSGTDGQGRGCNGCCKVRVAFQVSVAAVDAPPWARELMLQMFDAAVQAVRSADIERCR